jgi:nucleoside-diphosphate-sugar epimerase
MPTAFVTGASGFIGSEVARQLCDAGWTVTAARRASSSTSKMDGYDVHWVEADLHDPDGLTAVMPHGVDGVFHVAGNMTFWPREFDDQYRDNVLGTRAMVTAALNVGAGRFIYTSSGAAYGPQREMLRETLPSRALLSKVNYDRTKWLAEQEVHAGIQRGLDGVILNPAAVMGPRDENFTVLFERIAAGQLPAVMPARTSFCHIREVGRAHLLAFDKGRCGENYLLGGPNTSQLELARVIAEVAGSKPPKYEVPASLFFAVGAALEAVAAVTKRRPAFTRTFVRAFTQCWYTCSDKAIEELGYEPPSLHDIAQDTLEWLRAEGRFRAA